MSDLADLLAAAPRREPFTSDDPMQSYFRREATRSNDEAALLKLAMLYRACHPNPTWRGFTRWIA